MRFNSNQGGVQGYLPAPFDQNLGDMYNAMLRQNSVRGFPQQPFAGMPERMQAFGRPGRMQPFAGRPERMQPFGGMPFPGAAAPPPFAGGMYASAGMGGGFGGYPGPVAPPPYQGGTAIAAPPPMPYEMGGRFGGRPTFHEGGNPGGQFGPGAANRSPVWGGGFAASPGFIDPGPYQPTVTRPVSSEPPVASDDPYGGGFAADPGLIDPGPYQPTAIHPVSSDAPVASDDPYGGGGFVSSSDPISGGHTGFVSNPFPEYSF